MKAVILAAGVGKRLWPVTQHRPKCLIEIGEFLRGPRHPQHEALLRPIGTFILGPKGPTLTTNRRT